MLCSYYLPDGYLRIRPTPPAFGTSIINATTRYTSTYTIGGNWSVPASLAFPFSAMGVSSPWNCRAGNPVVSTASNCGQCSIFGDNLRLLYWPVALTWNGSSSSIITEAPRTTTQIVGNQTLTYPTIYLSYSALSASDDCGSVGTSRMGAIVPIPLDEIYLVSFADLVGEGYNGGWLPMSSPLDLGALPPNPLPPANYLEQTDCPHMCPTSYILDDWPYAPQIALPRALRTLEPAWASCGGYLGGSYDPPTALGPAPALATPTLPVFASSATPPSTASPTVTAAPSTSSVPTKPLTTADPTADPTANPTADPTTDQTADPTASPAADPAAKSTANPTTQQSSTGVSDPTTTSEKTAGQSDPSTTQPQAGSVPDAVTHGGSTGLSFVQTGSPQAVDPTTGLSDTDSSKTTSGNNPTPDPATNNALSVLESAADNTTPNAAAISSATIAAAIPSQTALTAAAVSAITIGGGQLVPAQSTVAASPAIGSPVISNVGSTPLAPSAEQQIPPTSTEQIISAEPSGGQGIVIAGTTLHPGQATSINDIPISVGTNNVVVAGSTISITQSDGAIATLPAVQSAASSAKSVLVISADPSDPGINIDGTVISPGQATTINNVAISAGTSNVVVASSTVAVPQSAGVTITLANQNPAESLAPTANAGVVLSANPSGPGIYIDGTAVSPGQETTISGTPVVVGTGNVIIGASTYLLPGSSVTTQLGGQSLTILPGGGVVVAGTTVDPGHAVTVSGTVISAASSDVVIGTQTYTLPSNEANMVPISFIAASTGADASAAVVGGSTISVNGPAITEDGHVYTLASSGIEVDGSLLSLATTSTTGADAIAGAIMSGLAGGGSIVSATVSATATATGTGTGTGTKVGSQSDGTTSGASRTSVTISDPRSSTRAAGAASASSTSGACARGTISLAVVAAGAAVFALGFVTW